MNKFIVKGGQTLRLGYTTGTCAAAATKAAALMLATGETINSVRINTPVGIELLLEITDIQKNANLCSCAVVKDAGDDPDVTDGLKIFSTVEFSNCKARISIEGGEGVGRITLPGLQIPVGEAAINPSPLKMIEYELNEILNTYPNITGFRAIISVPGGAEAAKKTFNPRLGIMGGISILGTTGIVEPMSEKALIDTIHLDMDLKYNQNGNVLLLTPGNYGLSFIKETWGIDLNKAVKCSNFIGEALDYALYLGFKSILLVGHIGKLLKLAAGIMNTHSKTADARMEILAAHAGLAGAGSDKIKTLMECTTTSAAFELLDSWKLTQVILKTVSKKIKTVLEYRTEGKIIVEFVMFGSETLYVSDEARLKKIICELNYR